MTNAIPFGDWLDEQGDDVRLVMCEGHPETLILVDTTNMGVYEYVPAENQDGVREATSEFLRKRMHELVRSILAFHNNPAYKYLDIKAVEAREKEFVEQARELGAEVEG